MKISKTLIMLISLTTVTLIASSASTAMLATDRMHTAIFVNQDELQWENAPPSLPKGVKMSVLLGDPGKPGPFVLRLMTTGDYTIPPHFHSKAETLTIISGALYLGSGERFDRNSVHALTVGGFHYLPAKSPHFAFTRVPTVVEIHGEGPFDIVYINREDDPRRDMRSSY